MREAKSLLEAGRAAECLSAALFQGFFFYFFINSVEMSELKLCQLSAVTCSVPCFVSCPALAGWSEASKNGLVEREQS